MASRASVPTEGGSVIQLNDIGKLDTCARGAEVDYKFVKAGVFDE